MNERKQARKPGGLKMRGFTAAILVPALLSLFVSCTEADPSVTAKVKTKFAADPTVKAYQINVDTKNGVVTLTGNVDGEAAKELAIRLAKETGGVVEVVDRISVKTSETTGDAPDTNRSLGQVIDDTAITAAVKVKLLDDPLVRGLRIDVDTREGIVYLTGSVRTQAEKDKAIQLARDTADVRDVQANLTIE